METGLVRYDAARRALEEAHTIDEVKDIRDKAEAMRLYAMQAKDNEMAVWAAEIKLRAEREAGRKIPEMQDEGAIAGHGGDRKSKSTPRTLNDHGISKQQSARWQIEADLSDDRFEEYIAECKESGDIPTAKEVRRLAKQEQQAKAQVDLDHADLPEGIYDVIVIDPPWPMQRIDRDKAPEDTGFDYPVMSLEDIGAIDIGGISADDCHLFCWTTQKFLPASLGIVREWGFSYICTFVWHKNGGMQPFNLPQYNCEFSIYARKGAPKFSDTKAFFTCFDGPRREHSRKPDEFYETVARVTNGRRVEVFAREARPGFEVHGNETDKFNGL